MRFRIVPTFLSAALFIPLDVFGVLPLVAVKRLSHLLALRCFLGLFELLAAVDDIVQVIQYVLILLALSAEVECDDDGVDCHEILVNSAPFYKVYSPLAQIFIFLCTGF